MKKCEKDTNRQDGVFFFCPSGFAAREDICLRRRKLARLRMVLISILGLSMPWGEIGAVVIVLVAVFVVGHLWFHFVEGILGGLDLAWPGWLV